MKNLQEIFAAERLIKNLMWLERRNPLLSPKELLKAACQYSDKFKEQLTQCGDTFQNEVMPMKTLHIMLRYLVQKELDTIAETKTAPKLKTEKTEDNKMARAFTNLAR